MLGGCIPFPRRGCRWCSGLQKDKKAGKAEAAPAPAPAPAPGGAGAGPEGELLDKVTAQGAKVAELKKAKAEKDAVMAEVAVLLDLKKQYKELTGQDVPAPAKQSSKVRARYFKEWLWCALPVHLAACLGLV